MVQISTGSTKLLELTGLMSVLELTQHTVFLVSTGCTFLEFTGLLELSLWKSSALRLFRVNQNLNQCNGSGWYKALLSSS